MITKLVIMRPGEPVEDRTIDLPERPSYGELDRVLRPLLDGADLEHVVVYTGAEPYLGEDYYRDMFIDDTGHAVVHRLADNGQIVRDWPGKGLPRNDAATELYLRNWRMHEPEKPEGLDDFIAGPAVLFPERRVLF